MIDTNGFFHFHGPMTVDVSDEQVTEWLKEVKKSALKGQNYLNISSGDTHVMMYVWDPYVTFIVSQRQGYASINIHIDDLPAKILKWERPKNE